jgi:hypothetical protein
MTNPERAELDILRAEKSRWEALREEDRAERARMMQEVNDLRSQVHPTLATYLTINRTLKWSRTTLVIYYK